MRGCATFSFVHLRCRCGILELFQLGVWVLARTTLTRKKRTSKCRVRILRTIPPARALLNGAQDAHPAAGPFPAQPRDGHQAPRLSGTAKAPPKRSYQLAQVMHHCTFPALSRDLLDMAQDRAPGSRPGKQEDGFQSMQVGIKRSAAYLIHALLTINHFF